jgi:serine/threonine-protein kinase
MRKHFGSLRRLQRLQVKTARQRPSDGESTLDCFTPARPIAGPAAFESSSHGAQIATLPGRRVFPVTRSKKGLGLALLAALAIGGVWFVRWREQPRPEPAVRTVRLEVDALPAGSEIFLDGTRVGQDRYRATPASSERKALLEARAPGYVSERKEVILRDDVVVAFVLQQEKIEKSDPPSSAPSLDPKAENEAKTESDPSRPSRSPAHPVTRSGKPRDKAPASAAAANCNPPYTFDADGVKTYKPECF